MKVLLLSQFYWPETRSAPTNLAAIAGQLQELGHEVLVITGFPNHPIGRLYDGYQMRWRQWDQVQGVRVLRVPLYSYHGLSGARRALHYSSFAVSSSVIGAWLTRHFAADVLFVYLPPITNWLPIRILKWIHRIPAMYWVTDLWPEALGAIGIPLASWKTCAIQRLDDAVNKQATTICVNSPGLKQRLVEKGIADQRVEVVTDWADESIFFPATPDPRLASRYGLSGKFNVVYGGTIGPAQGLEIVLDAADLLRKHVAIQFVLIGDGDDRDRLWQLAQERRLTNVRFIDRQPMSDIHRFFAIADALLTHLLPDPLFELQIPSKTMAYMACGRPIICGIAGAAAAVVEDAQAGLCCEPGNAESIAAAVTQMYALDQDQREAFGTRGRSAYLEKYTRSVQAAKLEELLGKTAKAKDK